MGNCVEANTIREGAISEKRTTDTEEQKVVSSCITWWSLTVGRSVMTFPLFWYWLLAYRLLDWGTGPWAKIPLPDISFSLANDPVFILNTRNTEVNHQWRHRCFLNPANICTCRQLLLLSSIFVQPLLLIKFVIIEARRAASVEHVVIMSIWMLNLQIQTCCASRYYNLLDFWFWNSRSHLRGSSSVISSPKKTWLPMAFPWTEILGTWNFRKTTNLRQFISFTVMGDEKTDDRERLRLSPRVVRMSGLGSWSALQHQRHVHLTSWTDCESIHRLGVLHVDRMPCVVSTAFVYTDVA